MRGQGYPDTMGTENGGKHPAALTQGKNLGGLTGEGRLWPLKCSRRVLW